VTVQTSLQSCTAPPPNNSSSLMNVPHNCKELLMMLFSTLSRRRYCRLLPSTISLL
jgi:hypothetical protein